MMVPRVLIACSGLGHVHRGNEAWARDAAAALHGAGVPIVLAGGGPDPRAGCPYVRLHTLPREFPVYRRWLDWHHRYLVEQLGFVLSLRRHVRLKATDIVHLCDPDLALQFTRRTRGWDLRTVFKDGMLLGPHWCSRMPFVQVLAPYYRDALAREAGVDTARWFVIPHLVDVEAFCPPASRDEARHAAADLNLPRNAFVVLGVGDFSTGGRKRLDWLVREVATLPPGLKAHLVLAGQSDAESFRRFDQIARNALGDRVRLLRNRPREEIARLYQVADVYAHSATREPFGIVFLEAMASGLPIIGHTWEVTRWILGDAGASVDMTEPGALARLLGCWAQDANLRAAVGARARRRALEVFSPRCVVPQYLAMYSTMMETSSATPCLLPS